ncbi:MAG: cell wall-binding repeat-containing protein [Acidimicrobiia bacterium]
MGKLARVVATVLGAALAMLGLAFGGIAAAAETDNAPNPEFWPASPTVSPKMAGYANAIRFFGADRYSTSLALSLALRGTGGFPFETPARQSSGAINLSQNRSWWGAATCPRSLMVVAGDNPADALAASALSDPTGKSSEPYLQRSAAADPLFDPIGGFAKVDTDNAPIIVTTSAREGATLLSPAANLAVRDLVSGGCQNAWQAIVVGGTAAVSASVEAELVSLGVPEVFRVSGPNRFATASAITKSLGTAPVPTNTAGCVSPNATTSSTKMGFYANSVIEYRASATECELLGRTVVLTDGMVGADALAAGWWTSFWQTPILLHNGEESLPSDTALALETTQIDNIVVLGGTARVSEQVVSEAVALTGARVIRVSGATRYETSVAMAKHFGGWWPATPTDSNGSGSGSGGSQSGGGSGSGSSGGAGTPSDASFTNSMVCFAASSGEGAGAKGWPDALGAGPLCASLNGAVLAANPNAVSAPMRALAPTNGIVPSQSPARGSTAGQPGHEAVPIILVPASGSSSAGGNTSATTNTMPAGVGQFLSEVFSPNETWCSSATSQAGCLNLGFAVLVGGEAVINNATALAVSNLVGGSVPATTATGAKVGLAPKLSGGFLTYIDMSPVFDVSSSPTPTPAPDTPSWFCAPRGSYEDLRWFVVHPGGTSAVPLLSFDVMAAKRYVTDSPTVQRSAGVGAPVCMALSDGGNDGLSISGISLAGRATPSNQTQRVNPSENNTYRLDGPIELAGPTSSSGEPSDAQSPANGTTSWTFSTPNPLVQSPAPTITSRGETETVTQASISIKLTRGSVPAAVPGIPPPTPSLAATHTFTGSWSINTAAGVVSGQLKGEAVLSSGTWKLRGEATAVGGTWNIPAGRGGFSADIATNNAGTFNDDAISWHLDGLITN